MQALYASRTKITIGLFLITTSLAQAMEDENLQYAIDPEVAQVDTSASKAVSEVAEQVSVPQEAQAITEPAQEVHNVLGVEIPVAQSVTEPEVQKAVVAENSVASDQTTQPAIDTVEPIIALEPSESSINKAESQAPANESAPASNANATNPVAKAEGIKGYLTTMRNSAANSWTKARIMGSDMVTFGNDHKAFTALTLAIPAVITLLYKYAPETVQKHWLYEKVKNDVPSLVKAGLVTLIPAAVWLYYFSNQATKHEWYPIPPVVMPVAA